MPKEINMIGDLWHWLGQQFVWHHGSMRVLRMLWPGHTFKVFNPRDIDRMFDSEVVIWVL